MRRCGPQPVPQQVDVSLNPLIQAESQLQEILDDGTCIIKTKEGEERIQEALFVSIYPPSKLTNRHGKLSFFLVNIFKVVDFPCLCKVYKGVLFCFQGKSYWNRWQTPIDTWNMGGLSSAGISRDVARMTKHENRGNNGSEHVEFVGGIEEMSRYVLEVTNMTNTTILTLEMIEVVFCFLCFCSWPCCRPSNLRRYPWWLCFWVLGLHYISCLLPFVELRGQSLLCPWHAQHLG